MNVTINTMQYNKEKKCIFHFNFDSQRDMNLSFLRMSEFSESPKYKGTYFEIGQVLAYYPKYLSVVLGHNISGEVFKEFIKVIKKDRLSERELFVISELEKLIKLKKAKEFYIIATCKHFTALNHEIAHAIYDFDKNYRREVNALINFYNVNMCAKKSYFRNIFDILLYKEYDKTVWYDELHAFLIDLGLGDKGFFYGRSLLGFFSQLKAGKVHFHFKYKKVAKKMKKIYIEYSKNIIYDPSTIILITMKKK